MSRKRKSAAKGAAVADARGGRRGNVVWRQSAEEATLAHKPRYNGYACGHGAHGSNKYNRAQTKHAWREQLRREGASRGSFPFRSANAQNAAPAIRS